MPFPDEPLSQHVEVVAYRPKWSVEGEQLTALLRGLLPAAISVDHVGSTSIPGMPSKDCIDLMVQVAAIDDPSVAEALTKEGFRRRPESWNQEETSYGTTFAKQVFAPPTGARPCNVHVREHGGSNVRYALLFRDYLCADAMAADTWGRFKVRLAQTVDELAAYGQIKAIAQEMIMAAAEGWAEEQDWRPYP